MISEPDWTHLPVDIRSVNGGSSNEDRTLIAIPLMMGLLFLPLGCGILGPRTLLEPTELCSDHGNSDIATFEDPNMERAVGDWSGVDARNDLTCGLVSGFEGVGFAGYRITSCLPGNEE